MEKSVISTNNAPAAIGPYSQAIKAGNLVFVSGQIPIVPATGEILRGDIKLQTRQALENLKHILEAAGSCIDNVVKTTVFMKDLNDYTAMGGSAWWLHTKWLNVILLLGLLYGISQPNGKKVIEGLAVSEGRVTDDIRAAYRKAVMAAHTGLALILLNVILGYWKPGY